MPIVPLNQAKNVVTPNNANKQGIYLWGDDDYTWGDDVATWGSSYSVTNRSKSTSSQTTISEGSPMGLLLSLTYPSDIVISGGWINTPKN